MKKRELTLKAGIFFVVLLLILSAVIMYEHKNDKKDVTIQYPVKGTLIFRQNRENKISVSSSF